MTTPSYASLEAFSVLMQGQDDGIIRHCLRMRGRAAALGRALGMEGTALRDLENAALLHDVGMFRIPAAVRSKTEPLDEADWAEIRRHPDEGADLVGTIATLEGAARLIRCHHERWDGEGYPQGLAGEAIPLGARVLAVVDAHDVMCTAGDGASDEAAAAELRRHAGTQFDTRVVEAFLDLLLQGD